MDVLVLVQKKADKPVPFMSLFVSKKKKLLISSCLEILCDEVQ